MTQATNLPLLDEVEPLEVGEHFEHAGDPILAAYQEFENFDDFVQLFMELYQQEQSDLWAWADATVAYSVRFGGSLKQLASSIPRSTKTLESYRHTARTFPPELRIEDVQCSIHRIAAYTEDPQGWLQKAADGAWSAKQLKEEIVLATGKVTGRCNYLTYYCLKQRKTLMSREQCQLCEDKCVVQGSAGSAAD